MLLSAGGAGESLIWIWIGQERDCDLLRFLLSLAPYELVELRLQAAFPLEG